MQALYLLALAPISETTADKNSYGFRSKRSTADAIEQCFKVLAQKQSAPWILEADIRSCFDQISHEWLMNNILIDKTVLKQWLAAGYMEKQTLMPTREGTPQGGIISPTLANITLDGLEETVINAVPKLRSKAHVVRYADDFIVTGASKELLEHKVKPAIQVFLERRGLMLSQEKTKITHISDGFNFLGFNIRKYANGKLLIKPSKGSILTFLRRIRIVIKKKATANTKQLISQLNPKLRGWAYYYRHVVAKQVFSMIDHNIFKALYNWIKRRHPRKSQRWRRNKYFRSKELRNWVFSTKIRQESGKLKYLDLFKLGYLAIIRHRKVKAEATPFDPAYKKYFEERKLLSMKCSPFHWVMHNKAQLAKAKYWIVQ
jgi:RNA-directed DNA polymerase